MGGPFREPPLGNFISSPLGLVPKKTPGQFRIIHDLSFPKGNSVNSHIPREWATVSYELLDDALKIIHHLGHGTLVAKADIESAFRIIPLSPQSYHLTGFHFNNWFYYDKVLPFGCSSSCQIFEDFGTAVHWILQHHFKVPFVSHIIDDYMFFGPKNSEICKLSLRKFMLLADDLGIPVKHQKTVHPCTKLELHGILVDTVQWSVSLPPDKTLETRAKLRVLISKSKATLREVQSAIGSLSFATKVIRPGRAFLRRLINLTVGTKYPHHHIRINGEAKADLRAWLYFLDQFNGSTIVPDPHWLSPAQVRLQTAASDQGYAAVLGPRWFRGRWPTQWLTLPAEVRDLFPIVTAIDMWASTLSNKNIILLCPSTIVATAINNTTSKNHSMMSLIRQLVITTMLSNILCKAVHAPQANHSTASELSTFQADVSHYQDLTTEAVLPVRLQPWSTKQQLS